VAARVWGLGAVALGRERERELVQGEGERGGKDKLEAILS
jgi:hypothetical protein